MRSSPVTTEMIKVIAQALGELNDRAVFVGGATVPFYLPETYHAQARPTEDINVVMEIVGKKAGWANEKLLRSKGFTHDTTKGAPVCRWIYKDLTVDIMSPDSSVSGFTNRWYVEGLKHAIEILSKPIPIRIFSAPYFLASKLETFSDRGRGDFRGSRDIEDVIAILEVSTVETLEQHLTSTSVKLKAFLAAEFNRLLQTSDFLDALPGAIFNRLSGSNAVESVTHRMERIATSAK